METLVLMLIGSLLMNMALAMWALVERRGRINWQQEAFDLIQVMQAENQASDSLGGGCIVALIAAILIAFFTLIIFTP